MMPATGQKYRDDSVASVGLYSAEVARLVHAQHSNLAVEYVDLIDAAWLLRRPSVGRQGLIKELEQQGAVHAVMADENDGVVDMLPQN